MNARLSGCASGSASAQWFDGITARARDAVVEFAPGWVRVRADERTAEYAADRVRCSAPLPGVPLRIGLPDGGTLVLTRGAGDAERFLTVPAEGFAHRLERNVAVVLVALLAVVATMVFAYREGLPWLAATVAQRVPLAAEAELGTATLAALDRYVFFPTSLWPERRAQIEERFLRLVKASETVEVLALEFRGSRRFIGANALALPGGTIVVTDELVRALDDLDQVAAVLAHEIGHEVQRHPLQQLLRGSISAVLMGAVFGDVSGVGSIAAAGPGIFINLRYSRAAEEEADARAFDLLQKVGSSPDKFADALETLGNLRCAPGRAKYEPDMGDEACRRGGRRAALAPDYLSTHPELESRIAAARAAVAK